MGDQNALFLCWVLVWDFLVLYQSIFWAQIFSPPSNIIQKTVSLIIHTECTGGDESINKCPVFLNSAVDACAQNGHTVVILFLLQPKKMRKKLYLHLQIKF